MAVSLLTEQERWQKLRQRLSPAVQVQIEARLQRWAQSARTKPSLAAVHLPTAVLVRRPGLPPRPLDPFFFEVLPPT